jgi:5-methylcytosine-specific restriction enzyme subunit McrC
VDDNITKIEERKKILTLHHREEKDLHDKIEKNEDNSKKIKKAVLNKNNDYIERYGCHCEVLEFDEENFTLKANDYFGYLELPGNIIIKSEGDYLQEYEQKKFFITDEDANSISRDINKDIKRIEIVGFQKGEKIEPLQSGAYTLKATSYVGVISLPSGFRIQIVPKISNIALYYMLCYLYDIEIPTFDKTRFPQGAFYLDIFALIFKSELEKIIEQGLFKRYVREEENLNFLRGKLLVSKQIKHNFINKQRFYCSYDELTYDNLENQTVLYALTLLNELVFSEILKQELVDLKWILESEVTPRRLLRIEEVNRITFSKLNDYYQKTIELSKQIIQEIYIDDIKSIEIQAFGFLIDMNKIFEEFIFRIIKEALPEYDVDSPEKIESLLKIHEELSNVKPPKVILKPDIIISNENEEIVVDTKYKKLDFIDEKAKVKSPDIYQIVSYSLAHKCSGMLIYPEDVKPIRYCYKFSDNLWTEGITWNVFVVTVDISWKDVHELSKEDCKRYVDTIKGEICELLDKAKLGGELCLH